MPTILLTRPLKDSERLAVVLRNEGYECLMAPMLTIVSTGQATPELADIAAVMITSGNVFDVLDANNPEIANLLDLSCFCVGTQTSEKARQFGFKKVFDAKGEGRALARFVQLNSTIDQANIILHIGAHDINSTAADDLRQAGFIVRLWPIYVAEAATSFPSDVVEALYSGQVNTVLFFSTRTAETFLDLMIANGLENACASIHAIGISQSVINAVADLPWWTISAAAEPTEGAIIKALELG